MRGAGALHAGAGWTLRCGGRGRLLACRRLRAPRRVHPPRGLLPPGRGGGERVSDPAGGRSCSRPATTARAGSSPGCVRLRWPSRMGTVGGRIPSPGRPSAATSACAWRSPASAWRWSTATVLNRHCVGKWDCAAPARGAASRSSPPTVARRRGAASSACARRSGGAACHALRIASPSKRASRTTSTAASRALASGASAAGRSNTSRSEGACGRASSRCEALSPRWRCRRPQHAVR